MVDASYHRELRELCKEANLCTRCRQLPPEPGKTQCAVCNLKKRTCPHCGKSLSKARTSQYAKQRRWKPKVAAPQQRR